mmetsp:Transcript_68140/g.156352  ORF Transcript_68140/g.156352 Transcript_68140/m.156352 type:complete len:86 (-) Transcript_68140:279-536(-)
MARARAALSNAVDVASTLEPDVKSLRCRVSLLEGQARAKDAQLVLRDQDLATFSKLYGTCCRMGAAPGASGKPRGAHGSRQGGAE